ncbi:MAG: SIMPL domain-containing protein [Ardenticatenaceae bacterium]
MIRFARLKGILAVAALAAVLTLGVACSNGGETDTPENSNEPTSNAPATSDPASNDQPSRGEDVPISQPSVGGPVTSNEGVPGGAEPAIGIGAPVEPMPAPAPDIPRGATAPSMGGFGFAGSDAVSSYGAPGYYPTYYTPQYNAGMQQSGIWVTGSAIINLAPDLAVLNIGVETTAPTVEEARAQAASAMDAIINALHARGIEDEDIQTQYFNIYPRYEDREVMENGIHRGKQELVGYSVTNSATVKIRDLEAVGEIIDEVAAAGGDATRINGVNFTVEDPKAQESTLREMAVQDAMAKAQQFAELTGVTLGSLTFITEISGWSPVVQDFARAEAALAQGAPPTPISPGQTQLSMTVQTVFAIE